MKPITRALIATAFCAALVSPASAVLISQTVTLTPASFLTPFSFGGFDSASGTLNSVRLDYSASVDAFVQDSAGLCVLFTDCEGDLLLRISGTGAFGSLSSLTSEPVTNAEVDTGVTKTLDLTGFSFLDPTAFLLPGGPAGLAALTLETLGDLDNRVTQGVFAPQYSAQQGSMKLTYDFSPDTGTTPTPTVPEPTTLALLGFGLAALARSRRKRG